MIKTIIIAVLTILILIGIITYFIYENVIDIHRQYPDVSTKSSIAYDSSQKKIIYVGVISRYPPAVIYQGYQPLMDYLTTKTEYIFELKLSRSYEETVNQLVNNEVSAAFLGSYVYIKAREKYDLKCILKPLNESGEQFFRSALIVKKESPINTIKDLYNRKIALPSEHSFSSNWFLYYELKKNKMSISDLDSIYNFAHHQSVIFQVTKGIFDAGVVREQIAKQYINRGIRIILLSPPVSGSPLVVSKETDSKIVEALQNTLLNLNPDLPETKKIMESWDTEFAFGFVEAKDKDYDDIRSIVKYSYSK